MRAFLPRFIALLLVFGRVQAADRLEWPELPVPEQARLQWVMLDGVLNGSPGRMARAQWPGSVDDALRHYRERWGTQRTENEVRGQRIVAARRDGFFYTVELKPLPGDQVQATLLQTRLVSRPLRSQALQSTQAWLLGDSRLLQTLESDDDGRRSLQIVADSTQSLDINASHLLQQARAAGLTLQRQQAAAPDAQPQRVLWLDGPNEEVVVVIRRSSSDRVAVLINRQRKKPA